MEAKIINRREERGERRKEKGERRKERGMWGVN